MKNQKLWTRISIFCYLAMILAGLALGITMIVAGVGLDTDNPDAEFGEALGAAIGLVIVIVVSIISFIYAALAIFPFAFKLRYLRRPRRIYPILSMVFDLLFIGFGGALFVSSLTGDGVDGSVFVTLALALAVILPVFTFVVNILQLKAQPAEESVEQL